jgi:hypothetical protein
MPPDILRADAPPGGAFLCPQKIKIFLSLKGSSLSATSGNFLFRHFNNLAPSCGIKTFLFSFIFTYVSRT